MTSQTRQPTAAAGPIPVKSAPTRLRSDANTVRGNYLRMNPHAVPTRELQSGGSPTHDGLTRLDGHGERSPPPRTPAAANLTDRQCELDARKPDRARAVTKKSSTTRGRSTTEASLTQ